MNVVDLDLFYWLNSFIGKSAGQDFFVVFFASYVLCIVLVVFIYSAYAHWKKYDTVAPYIAALVSALAARFVVAEIIRFFYHHPRPFVELGSPHLITDLSYSFPSGHAIFMFALATAVYFFNKRLALWFYIAAVCTGIARVAAGVHYPSDILGGAVLGVATSVVLHLLYMRLKGRG